MTYPIMAPEDLTQRQRPKWIVRTGWNSSQPNHPIGEYAYQTLKLRKVAVMGLDYAFGWECVGGFQKTFEEAGGKIIQKIWTPLTVTDFSPYLAQISKDADGVYAMFTGRSTLQFTKQYQEFGLKGKLILIGGGTTTDEHALPSMGDEAIGIMTALHYSEALDNPANKKFVKAYRAKAKKAASYYSEGTYTGMRWIIEAIKAINGDVENRAKVDGGLEKGGNQGCSPGCLQIGRLWEPGSKCLCPESGEGRRRAPEHGDLHLSQCFTVLEIQTRGIFETAGL